MNMSTSKTTQADVDPHKTPAAGPQTVSSYTVTITNNATVDLYLSSSQSSEPWTTPPPQQIAANGGQGKFVSPGAFAVPCKGFVTYQTGSGESATFNWDIPNVGSNVITWGTSGANLSMSESGSLSGWNVSNAFTVTGS